MAGSFIHLLGETYYRIDHYDQMPPFFMSLVSSTNLWLFIASNGGLTAGRTNADSALFPYETEDKIAAHSEQTGGKSLVRIRRDGQTRLWEPFSDRYAGAYCIERHLYKNVYGNKLVFEEINHELQLTLRTGYRTGDRFGIVKSSWLRNDGDDACRIELLDGFQNLLPYGVVSGTQGSMSCLLDAYKRSELEPRSGLGIFSLSAALSDRPEPSESLQASVAWQVGLEATCHLLSTDQLDAFRSGHPLNPEHDLRGKAGSYLVQSGIDMTAGQTRHWHIVADVNQDSADVVSLLGFLGQEPQAIEQELEADIDQGTADLVRYVAAADGLQLSAQETTTAHHFSNVLFNIMRGGIFADGYWVEKRDFENFVSARNRPILATQSNWFATLPDRLPIESLYARAAESDSPDLIRLCYEYLPLIFSRRHGDPSRPWNRFSINLKQPDGSPRLDYQGNWRDIFQNWEALILAFPAYIEGTIAKFLNATTLDGYNPYRITRDGVEWEVPEPNNPWANIGYWSDHQIIYLQKLLEIADQLSPGMLPALWNRPVFAYANVPYRLRPYHEMREDWSATIDFDWEREKEAMSAAAALGTDGRLHRDAGGNVIHVTMMEKLLVLLLAKISNLVPGGGIWMNTQRPEWNDANNALVGKGLSVVTTAYLRRFVAFWRAQMEGCEATNYPVNATLALQFTELHNILARYQSCLNADLGDHERQIIMDALGSAATAYRSAIYREGVPAGRREIKGKAILDLLDLVQRYIEQALRANRREDGLYHAYNLLRFHQAGAAVEHLYPMLEGQVAILSSGMLPPEEALALLNSLRHSDLYRPDQHSYLLYPDRELPGFLEKNRVTEDQVKTSKLVSALAADGDRRLLVRDESGEYHFHGAFHNANDVSRALDLLAQEPAYADLVAAERGFILDLFEDTFNHRAFTGRSGTFFAYEGLGSIYWHMVAKLLLAVQECHEGARASGANVKTVEGLASAYYDIRQGFGFNKSPAEYGAFPTDPYSHTPAGSGARQPGMTGQVKEMILTRLGELGVSIRAGELQLAPALLQRAEFLPEPATFSYIDVAGQSRTLPLPAASLAFTFCQTPVVYTIGDASSIEVVYSDGRCTNFNGTSLDASTSRHIFERDGEIALVRVSVKT